MFANISYQDKQAFFSLLDEYFESRPHLTRSQSPQSPSYSPTQSLSQPQSASQQVQQLQTLSRFLSPPAAPTGPQTPKTDEQLLQEAKQREKEAQRIDQVARFAQKSVKHGTNATRSGIGMISRNEKAMGALDKYGAGVFVRGAESMVGKKNDANAENGNGGSVSPPPKKGGVSGLVSGKSFGHVDTSSKMGAFTSMWKDPQKVQAKEATTTVASPTPSALSRNRDNLPPPPRRAGSGSAPVPEPVETHEEIGAEGQAQAIYDYTGADSGDLSVQNGQIVNVLEKTSADWWMCEDGNGTRGLVPANYLKEV